MITIKDVEKVIFDRANLIAEDTDGYNKYRIEIGESHAGAVNNEFNYILHKLIDIATERTQENLNALEGVAGELLNNYKETI